MGAAIGGCLLLVGLTTAASDVAEFEKLLRRKTELELRLRELHQLWSQTRARGPQQQVAEEIDQLRGEFRTVVFPRLSELAQKVYAADRRHVVAGETAAEAAFLQNRYAQTAQITTQLLSDGHASPLVRNLGGVAHFALHDFTKAAELLREAQQAGQLSSRAAPYLEACATYTKLWEAEQALRAQEDAADADHALPRVKLVTNRGEIVLELFENQAPNTVANFVSLVEARFYDGVKFHRVIPNFMVQTGDPLSKDDDPQNDGTGGPGYAIRCECYRPDARKHFRGSVSMAHAGRDTGGSQFFITHLPTVHLNPQVDGPNGPSGHTVFGRVLTGMDVVDAVQGGDVIETARVLRKRPHPYRPETIPE